MRSRLALSILVACLAAPLAATAAPGPQQGAACPQPGALAAGGTLVCGLAPPPASGFVWQSVGTFTRKRAKPKDGDRVITASLVDPAQIQSISKFRSCDGHVYYGLTDFHGRPEGASSMKHYFAYQDSLLTTLNGQQQVQPRTVKMYAPFNGVVSIFDIGGTGQGIEIERQPFDGWYMSIYHTDPVVRNGARVRAGQLIAYGAALPTFDVAMQRFSREVQPGTLGGAALALGLESMFAHMTASLTAKWAAHGVSTASIVVPQADRLAQPCTCVQNGPAPPGGGPAPTTPYPGSSGCYFESDPNTDLVRLSP